MKQNKTFKQTKYKSCSYHMTQQSYFGALISKKQMNVSLKTVHRYLCVCFIAQSCPTLCDPRNCSRQALPSMEFSRQERWGGMPFPPPGALPERGIKPRSPSSQTDSLLSEPPERTTDGSFICNVQLLEKSRCSSMSGWVDVL